MRRLLPLALLFLVPVFLAACGGGGGPSTVSQEVPAAGGTVALGNDVTVQIPPGALADASNVTITKKNAPDDALPGGQSLGAGYNIELGGQTLSKPVTLEIAYDPDKRPPDGVVFLGYYDETKGSWIPVAGRVDEQRNVIIVQTDHLSWWNPFSWNWGAWIAVLNNLLTANVTDFLQAVALLTNDCPQSGSTVTVDSSGANNVIQGCVERDDASSPQLRVVNPKSFFYEVKPVSGGNGYPPQTMLGPGGSLPFQANTSDPVPLVVAAEMTQASGARLVVHLIIQMLPGLREVGIQPPQIACITERVHDVSYIAAAVEALLLDHDGAAAAEQITRMLLDADAMRRFITAASGCGYGAAPTWSVEGIKQIGAATATIMSATDFVANYFLNYHSQMAFGWTQPPTPMPTPTRPSQPPSNPEAEADLQSFAADFLRACYEVDLTRYPQFVEPPAYAQPNFICVLVWGCVANSANLCHRSEIKNITLEGGPACREPSPADLANGWGRYCMFPFRFAIRAAGSNGDYYDLTRCVLVQSKSGRYFVREGESRNCT